MAINANDIKRHAGIKQEQGEPVAYIDMREWPPIRFKEGTLRCDIEHLDGQALYTTQQRKPLTIEQRFDLLAAFEPHKNKWEALSILIDMVEAAHNIKD